MAVKSLLDNRFQIRGTAAEKALPSTVDSQNHPVSAFAFHALTMLYKVAATAFDCILGTGPAYFKHVCTPASDISGRAHLRSAERRDMLVPRTRTELGRRSFPVAAPTVWNSLPAHLRSALISRRQFGDWLKSHLFADAYF